MEVGGQIAKIVMRDLNVPENKRLVFWITHMAFVTKTHRTKRNNICMTLKDSYMSKCWYCSLQYLRERCMITDCYHLALLSEQYKRGNIITLERVLHARDTLQDFKMFCDTFLSNVVGKNLYKTKFGGGKVCKIATVGNEAFAILCVKNSIKRWQDEAKDPSKSHKENWRTT